MDAQIMCCLYYLLRFTLACSLSAAPVVDSHRLTRVVAVALYEFTCPFVF